MFSRLIRSSMPICGICRNSSKNNFQLLKNSYSKLKVASVEKRYFNVTLALYTNKQNPKQEQPDQLQNEKKDQETQQKEKKNHRTQQSSTQNTDKKNDSTTNQQAQDEEETDDENDKTSKETIGDKYKRQRTESFDGKSLVLHNFANAEKKEKDTFLECLKMYEKVGGAKRERVPFIYAALKFMEEFGVHKDLAVYKQLIDIFPKEKMIPTNQFQTMFMHYPREQYCCVSILEQMEDNGVIPDPETELLLLNIFGRHGLPLQKYWKMMYWMPKFRNLNPWPVPNPIPSDPYDLAKLAMEKIGSVDVESKVTIFDSEDIEESIDKTWIVSVMSPVQSELLQKHDKNNAIYVEGPFVIYVATKSVDYFTLRADPMLNRKFPDQYDPDGKPHKITNN